MTDHSGADDAEDATRFAPEFNSAVVSRQLAWMRNDLANPRTLMARAANQIGDYQNR